MKFIFAILLIKCLACFAYYWVYFCYYPAGFNGDSVSTLHDAKIMYSALPNHPTDFLKMIFGLHSESDFDPLYEPYFKDIEKWGRADVSSNFFLNDNRTPIRINAVIMLFSFGNYAVHAFFMMAISFIGQFAFYKAFKKYFIGNEFILASIVFLTPSILFWTSGVLKEPIAFSLLGLLCYTFMRLFIERNISFKYGFVFTITIFMFLIIKPYILVLLVAPLLLFALVNYFSIKKIGLFYILSLLIIYGGVGLILKFGFQKDVIQTIVVRQNDFINLSKGGTFLLNDEKYVRFEYTDTIQYEMHDSTKKLYRIKPNAHYMYWNPKNLRDTFFVNNNTDTSLFRFISKNTESGSAISMERLDYSLKSFIKVIPKSFYNVLCKPFFYDSRTILELIASFENLIFILFASLCFYFRTKNKVNKNILVFCIIVVITSFLLVGLTTTVLGAIVRYKIPFIPFLLMIPLLYLDPNRIKEMPFLNRIIKKKG